MSNMEGVAENLNAGIESMPFAQLAEVKQTLQHAYSVIGNMSEGGLALWEQTCGPIRRATEQIANTEDTLLAGREHIATYMADVGLGAVAVHEPNNPFDSAPDYIDTAQRARTVASLQDIARTLEQGAQVEDATYAENLKRLESLKSSLIEALRDPAQAAVVLHELCKLANTGYERGARAVRTTISDIVFTDKGRAVLGLAKQTKSADIADEATVLLFDMYGARRTRTPQPQAVTQFLTEENNFCKGMEGYCNIKQKIDRGEIATPHQLMIDTPADTWGPMIKVILENTQNLGRDYEDLTEAYNLIRSLVTPDNINDMQRTRYHGDIGSRIFEKMGLNFIKMDGSWNQMFTKKEFNMDDYKYASIKKILCMQGEIPGSPKTLHETFGLTHIARYGIHTMKAAYQAALNPPERYILAVFPGVDHNAATQYIGGNIEEIVIDLTDNADVIIPVEIPNMQQAYAMRDRLQAQGWGPAQRAIACIHGHQKSLELNSHEHASTESNSPQNWRASKLPLGPLVKGLVAKGGHFLMVSCSTGKGDENIAQYIANASGREVIAPPENVSAMLSADVDTDTGKVIIKADFATDHRTRPVQARTFTPKTA